MKKTLLLIAALFTMGAFRAVGAAGDMIEVGGQYYQMTYIQGEEGLRLVAPPSGAYSGDLYLPCVLDYEGKTYPVDWGSPIGYQTTEITGVTVGDGWATGPLVGNRTFMLRNSPLTDKVAVGVPGASGVTGTDEYGCFGINADSGQVMDLKFEYTDESILIHVVKMNVLGPDGKQLAPHMKINYDDTGYIAPDADGIITLPRDYSYGGESGLLTLGSGRTVAIFKFFVDGSSFWVRQAFDSMKDSGKYHVYDGIRYVEYDGGVWVYPPAEGHDPYSGDVVIPVSFVDGGKTYVVKGIDNKAFYQSDITSLTIQGDLDEIGVEAVEYCQSLKRVSMAQCEHTLIGVGTFAGCRSLEEVELPASSNATWHDTFSYCQALKSVNVPRGAELRGTFYGCEELIGLKVLGREFGIYTFSVSPEIFEADGVTPIPFYCKTEARDYLPEIVSTEGNTVTFKCPKIEMETPEGQYRPGIAFYFDSSKSNYLNVDPSWAWTVFNLSIPETDAVDEITADDDSDAPAVYYNLQGVRVDEPGAGLYIRVRGTRTDKVLLR